MSFPAVCHHTGLYGSARSWLIAELSRKSGSICVICRNRKTAEDLFADLQFFSRKIPVQLFTGWETIPFENVSPQTDISASRLSILRQLRQGKPLITVAPLDAVAQRTVSADFIDTLSFSISLQQHRSREELAQRLTQCGYQAVSLCEEVGEITVHGSVIDIFSPSFDKPVRIFFSGEEVSALKVFDPDTQRTSDDLDFLEVVPVREITPFARHPHFEPLIEAAVEKIKSRGRELETPAREIATIINNIKTGAYAPGSELVDVLVRNERPSLFDFLTAQTLLVLDDELAIKQAYDLFAETVNEREERLSAEHYLIPQAAQLYLPAEETFRRIAGFNRHVINSLELGENGNEQELVVSRYRTRSNTELSTRLKTGVGSGQALQPLKKFIEKARRSGARMAFSVGARARAERLHHALLGLNFEAKISNLSGLEWLHAANPYPLVILPGQLSNGFQLEDQGLVFISENEIFAERSYRKAGRAPLSLKRLMGSLAQLSEDDFVVHVDYGVGRYRGLRHLEVEGAESDFLHIEYADSTLYLPVQSIGKVQKFMAAEGQTPVLDKLASKRWVQTRQKVRDSVAELAGDLIKLYAARSVARGWRFEPYGAEDERFAENFPYNETADQLKAITETVKDMATEKPMDRLVCGDVGFGKTEVALRAAFKCVQHTRQAAVLVPTTILAEQHYQNFCKRFADYPVKVAVISRFQSPQANRKTLEALASGELDIIIGTHRLLSRDVIFKDLGLLIIDEEHRFGVKQKEKLKSLKKQVDVLTLTATPIPRTLHMSLLGIRDISVISTPPTDRRAIRTYVAAWDETLIRDAMLRELQRGGQCFFLYNRVESIDVAAANLHRIIPEARLAFAHGQMSEKQLEPIMARFLKREIDVLVTTTIIESGLDIPNANTIIIDRADAFGLAQLYQLRGRVGRSNKQAYCYFLVPKARKLGPEAQKRLKALQALDDLGLGFNLALRDMEIRGAGNLLGREQSGNVLAVGFELYSRILKEAIANLKGEDLELKESIDPEIKLGVNAFIPQFYIPDISERLVLYQRLSTIENDADADALLEEIKDRYGPPGIETANLLEIMRLRAVLRDFGIVKAEVKAAKLLLSFSPAAQADLAKLIQLEKKEPEKFRFGKNLTLAVALDEKAIGSPSLIYAFCRSVLSKVAR